jgi:hypothetical protein
MERKLKVYIYREGEKPIFHQPKMRGLYASEGWFMKLMEGNKRFIVKDPKKAHLFYLPFSSQILRANLSDNKKMEQYLERYVNLIAGRYRFWNRTGGVDHFLLPVMIGYASNFDYYLYSKMFIRFFFIVRLD